MTDHQTEAPPFLDGIYRQLVESGIGYFFPSAKPESIEHTREPNRQLGFGFGIHYCLGAPLARMEAQIAISTLLRKVPVSPV